MVFYLILITKNPTTFTAHNNFISW